MRAFTVRFTANEVALWVLCLSIVSVLAIPRIASATLIETIITDTEENLEVTWRFEDQEGGTSILDPKLDHWDVSILVFQVSQFKLVDLNATHIARPHDEPNNGDLFEGDDNFFVGDSGLVIDVSDLLDHDLHFDRYRFTYNRPTPNLEDVELRLVGVHVPEPSTILLLVLGLGSIGIQKRFWKRDQ